WTVAFSGHFLGHQGGQSGGQFRVCLPLWLRALPEHCPPLLEFGPWKRPPFSLFVVPETFFLPAGGPSVRSSCVSTRHLPSLGMRPSILSFWSPPSCSCASMARQLLGACIRSATGIDNSSCAPTPLPR